MEVREDRRYTEDHEWAKVENGRVRVGITDYAQDQLGDVVFVELPEVGTEFEAGQTLATVESTKSVADVYAPLGGTVAEVNERLVSEPELVNQDPYGDGWFVALDAADTGALDALLDAAAYRSQTEE